MRARRRGMARASRLGGDGLVRRRDGKWLCWNDIAQCEVVAATSCAGHGETGRSIAGAVSVCSNVPGRGLASGDEHSADAACGGGTSRNCSTAERQLGRWCSGPRPRRGVSIRDAGAWHRSTSAMNCVKRKPRLAKGTSNGPSRSMPAASGVLAKWGETRGGIALAARRLASSAAGSSVGRYEGSQFCRRSGCAAVAGALCCAAAVPARAFAPPGAGGVRSHGRAGSLEPKRPLAWCHSALYSAMRRMTPRRMHVPMTWISPVSRNPPVWP